MLVPQLQLGTESEMREKWSSDGDLFGQLLFLQQVEMRHEVTVVEIETVHSGEEMSDADVDDDPLGTLT